MKTKTRKNDNVRFLFKEIFRVYKKAPFKITFIWILDILESLIIISDPYVIGKCIDGLSKKNFFWFAVLIAINVIFWLSRTANKFGDTRIYSHIVEDESCNYYARMIKADADCSLISARLDLVDDIPNFLEIDFFDILNMVGGIAVSLFFLYCNSTLLVFSLAAVSIIFIPAATYRFQKETVKNNRKYKDLDEERMKVIESRNKEVYGKYIRNILGIGISNSDLDTKIFFVAYFLQMILLFSSIISITHTGNFTSGLLFSTVTYVEMLNGYVSDINENLILLHDLKETITRLKEDSYNEL